MNTTGRETLDLAMELAQAQALISGRVSGDDVVEVLVEQLAAVVVGQALNRGRPIDVARAQAHALLDEAITEMAADCGSGR